MRILFLSQIIPFPPNAGPRVKSWNTLRFLVERGHEVHLASFVRPDEYVHVDTVRNLCASIRAVPIRRSRKSDLLAWIRSHLSGRPFLVERDDLQAMSRIVREMVKSRAIEAIHADQLTMAQFAFSARKQCHKQPALVFDAHNAVWMIARRMATTAPLPLRPILRLEANRLRRYEGKIVRLFDHTITVSESDKEAMLEALRIYDRSTSLQDSSSAKQAEPRLSVVPIAVDTTAKRQDYPGKMSSNILAIGTLHYPPNADGIRWFATKVLPLVRMEIPEATLTIVGKNPPGDFWRMERDSGTSIRVTGYVDDLDPYMEMAALMVVPVRVGGGMSVRILEGLARGIPMVTTTVGLEGIEAIPGKDILVGDEPEDFAKAVVQLIRDERLRERVAQSGRALVEQKYDSQTALEPLMQIYGPKAMGERVSA